VLADSTAALYIDLRKCLIGMEACGGSLALREQGHDVRLMPAQYVKPYVKTNKNDYIDAEACSEAVTRPTMRFVPIKSDDCERQPREANALRCGTAQRFLLAPE
jgi:transposase